MIKRCFDIFFSFFGIIVLIPFFFIISIFIFFDSRGGIFYIQKRIGLKEKEFGMFKFRSMYVNADKKGLLTVGNNDVRITRVGYYLRKYKIDELPQLFNVFNGTMSFVGPRPEVKKYVKLYSVDQKKILNVKPGITDYASLKYVNENEILANSANPELIYINEVLPEKIKLNKLYIDNQGLITDLKIILKTVRKIIK